jgi:DNA-binding NarL/FixJ family response regulator
MHEEAKSCGGILIVDDHPLTVHLLFDLLSAAFPLLQVRSAKNAEEALQACRLDIPRVVVLDIGLPATSGIEVAAQIKALSSSVGIVMHSIFDHEIYREKSIAAGADAFVSKTRTYAELLPAVARLMRAGDAR